MEDYVTDALEEAIIFVREEEQKRILKLFHGKVVPHLLAAMVEAQTVKEELESKGLQEGEAVSRMIKRLVKAVYGIESIADLEQMHADPHLAALFENPISFVESARRTAPADFSAVSTRTNL